MLTADAARLTEAHRLVQAGIARQAQLAVAAALRAGLDPRDLERSFARYATLASQIVQAYRGSASTTASAYYRALRELEGVTSALPDFDLAPPVEEARLLTSLAVTGPVAARKSLASGASDADAIASALSQTLGAVGRHVQNGQRETLTSAVMGDPSAHGYARITDGRPCAFCAMLVGRGPVYKSEATADFRSHDRCGCGVAPFFEGDDGWTAQARAYAAQYESAQRRAREELGRDPVGVERLNAFRRHLTAKAPVGDERFARWRTGRDLRLESRDSAHKIARLRSEIDAAEGRVRAPIDKAEAELATARARLTAEEDRLKSYVGDGADYRKARKTDSLIRRAEEDVSFYEASLVARRRDAEFSLDAIAKHRARIDRFDAAGPLPEFTTENPLAGYGDRLHFADESATTALHLHELETYFPLPAHRTLRDHFTETDGGGFYLGERAVPHLDDLGRLSGVRPRGWREGSTWDEVPGAYSPSGRVCACGGGGGTGHGSTSLALHEGSHALDDAIRTRTGVYASETDEWRTLWSEIEGGSIVSPYYTPRANPDGYFSEAFAEGFAAWSKHTGDGLKGGALGYRLMRSLGATGSHTALQREGIRLAGYFSDLVESLA